MERLRKRRLGSSPVRGEFASVLPWHRTELGLCWIEMDGMEVGGREGGGQKGKLCICVCVCAGVCMLKAEEAHLLTILHFARFYTYTQTVGCTYISGSLLTKHSRKTLPTYYITCMSQLNV